MSTPRVVAVSRASGHRFSKRPEFWIDLVAGIGVDGDAHAVRMVQAGLEGFAIAMDIGEECDPHARSCFLPTA